MEHKGTQYSVVQTAAPSGWKWAVNTERGTRIGTAPSRTLAILRAIKAIDKEKRQIRAARRKSEQLERKAHTTLPDDMRQATTPSAFKNAPMRPSARSALPPPMDIVSATSGTRTLNHSGSLRVAKSCRTKVRAARTDGEECSSPCSPLEP